MRELIRDCFAAFAEAIIRFWNNRFLAVDEKFNLLVLELEKERAEKNKLLAVIIELASPQQVEAESEINIKELKPIGKPDWRYRARMLEERQRQLKQQMNEQKLVTTAELEKELNVNG